MAIYIGIDLGTSMLKAMAVDSDGRVLASFGKETPIINRQTDWAEQSPELWWSMTVELLSLMGTKIDMKKVEGVGLSGQMHGLVALDKKMGVLKRAIIWMDKRSREEVEEILDKVGREKIYEVTGNPIFTGFLLSSLLWTKKHEPEIFAKIFKVVSPKDYLAYRLTGVLRSEPTDALATGAFDYSKGSWSLDILKVLGLSEEIFAEVELTEMPYGGILEKTAKITGIRAGVKVFGAGDQAMAAMGMGLIDEGMAAIAISTGGQFLVVDKRGLIDKKRRLHTLNHAIADKGFYMAATLAAGFSLRWFKNFIAEQENVSYTSFLEEVGSVPVGSGDLFFLPFLSGERTPYFNSQLRGAYIGLSADHKRRHLARAILEGVAFSMRDCFNVFEDMGIGVKKVILSGGGAKDAVWRQIITDVVNLPTHTINIEDHSPFGAAIFSKFAQEDFKGLGEFYKRVIKPVDFIYPNEKNVLQYSKLFESYKGHASYLESCYIK